MGLGLVVGIAALGVIAARSVVERRQQIGILRSLGFQRGMVQLTFLLESSFVALLGITIGVLLGAFLAYNVMDRNLVSQVSPADESDEESFALSDLNVIFFNRGFWYITALCVLFYSAVFPFYHRVGHRKWSLERGFLVSR